MCDFDTWKDCLSFLSISVIWNLGCILINKKDNPITRLFSSTIINNYEDTKAYRSEYSRRMDELNTIFKSKENWNNVDIYLKYINLSVLHLNINDSYEDIEIHVRKSYPMCFSYACLILSFYSLLGLSLIPIIELNWVLNAYTTFSAFVVLTLTILLIIEFYKLIFRKKEKDIDENFSTKYLVWEVYWALLGIGVSIKISDQQCLSAIYSNLEPYACYATIVLPYIPFIVCFIWYSIVRVISWIKLVKINKYKKEFDKLYDELKKKMDE